MSNCSAERRGADRQRLLRQIQNSAFSITEDLWFRKKPQSQVCIYSSLYICVCIWRHVPVYTHYWLTTQSFPLKHLRCIRNSLKSIFWLKLLSQLKVCLTGTFLPLPLLPAVGGCEEHWPQPHSPPAHSVLVYFTQPLKTHQTLGVIL